MSKLEDIQPNASFRGILPDALVTFVSVQWFGSEALDLAYKDAGGKLGLEILDIFDPGMAVYTRFAKVLDAEGKPLSVREALALINQILDKALAEQEGDFDADSQWALAWFEQYGFAEGEYGVAETLSLAKNTSVQGLKDAGILDKKAPGGKVRLLRPKELTADWDPTADARLTAWEMVHQLIRVLEDEGESRAAVLAASSEARPRSHESSATAPTPCASARSGAAEALSYNGLVQSWPEITRLAREGGQPRANQDTLFDDTQERNDS